MRNISFSHLDLISTLRFNIISNWKFTFCYMIGTEICERLAYYGISKSLVTYLSTRLHEGNVSAARNFTTWQGTCYLTPIIGATIADSYCGKYRTIAVFSTIYFLVSYKCTFILRNSLLHQCHVNVLGALNLYHVVPH